MCAAPVGNKFAIGNSGKPKMWKTVEDLQKDLDAYFLECTHDGEVKRERPIPYTIEGLCETLDCDRKTVLNYQKQAGYEDYFHTITRAKMKIQRNKLERGLSGDSNAQVTKFDLSNNHLYVEKTEQEITFKEKTIADLLKPDENTTI